MEKYLIRTATFLGCSLPWAFFAMYGDAQWDTMAVYGVMVLCLGGLWRLAVKDQCMIWASLGAIVSLNLSRLCVLWFATEKWAWYFKPLTADSFAVTISVIVMLVWLVAALIVRKKGGENVS